MVTKTHTVAREKSKKLHEKHQKMAPHIKKHFELLGEIDAASVLNFNHIGKAGIGTKKYHEIEHIVSSDIEVCARKLREHALRSRHRTTYSQVSNQCLDFKGHYQQLKIYF